MIQAYLNADLTFNPPGNTWQRLSPPTFEAKGRYAAAHGGFPRFLKDVFGIAKRVRADIAAGGPEARQREAAEKEARYAAFLKSRTAADLAALG